MLETYEAIMNERDIRISGLIGTLELLPEGHPMRRIYEGHLREIGADVQARGTHQQKSRRLQDQRATAGRHAEDGYLLQVVAEGRNV